MRSQVRVTSVLPLGGYQLKLSFTNGTEKTIDVKPFLRGPVFEPLKSDPTFFETVRVDQRLGTIVWPNGADIDPDVLYLGLQPAWMSETNAESTASTV